MAKRKCEVGREEGPFQFIRRELEETRLAVGKLAENGEIDPVQFHRLGARAETLADLENIFRLRGWDD